MKKNSLLKVLGIAFLVFVVLSWIFPAGSYNAAEYTKEAIMPIGLFDLGYYPLITVSAFMQYGIVFLTIGGLYGVLNKTGVYAKLVKSTAKLFENSKMLFMILSIVGVSLYVSLTGLVMPVMVIIPFIYAVMNCLGFSKQSSAAATIGAIFAGIIGNTVGYHSVYISEYLGLDLFNLRTLAFKIMLYVLVTALLVFYVYKRAKKELNNAEVDNNVLLFNEAEETKKSLVPAIVILVLVGLLVVVSMYPWSYALETTFFEDLYEKVMGFTVKEFPVFQNLLGSSISPFGYWLNYELATLMIFASVIIGWIYGVKFEDIIKSFGEGCKRIFSVAFYACLANVIFAVMLNTSVNICFTFVDYLARIAENFSVPATAVMTGIGSFFYNDFNYLVANVTTVIATIYSDTTNYPLIAIITQSIYGVIMLFAPVSVALLAGLRIFDVNYKDWFKYMWKYILEIALIVMAVVMIISFI